MVKHPKILPSMRSFHFDYLSRVAPSLTKLVQFHNEITSHFCPRSECKRQNLIANSEHIVYDCVFVASIIHFIKEAYIRNKANIKMDDMFYLFPHLQIKNLDNSLEKFVLATQIKITAFQVITDNKFHTWNQFHFSVKLLQIIKTSIEICDLYCIPISFLHALLDYTQEAAHGAIHFFMIDF